MLRNKEIAMTLEQLRIFVAVAERQHVTQAARVLNLAQSATSHAIAALETRHDTKLFNRVGRGIELTEAGHVFLASAKFILARVEAAELMLNEFGSLKRGTLAVQASQTIASYWLPRHLVAFRQAYPQIEIRLAIGNTAQVAAAVENGTAELGFVEGVVENEHFASTPVARDQLVLVVGPTFRIGRNEPSRSPDSFHGADSKFHFPVLHGHPMSPQYVSIRYERVSTVILVAVRQKFQISSCSEARPSSLVIFAERRAQTAGRAYLKKNARCLRKPLANRSDCRSLQCLKRLQNQWLPFLNTYRTMALPPSPSFRAFWRKSGLGVERRLPGVISLTPRRDVVQYGAYGAQIHVLAQ
jgi:DNA-binding transcriptional LysR family regulator